MTSTEIPFELHITTESFSASRQAEFVSFCSAANAKPLLIELAKGEHTIQPMFSKVVYTGNIDKALSVATGIAVSLDQAGFPVKRLKIEVPAEHSGSAAIQTDGVTNYFECHLKIRLYREDNLLSLCEKHQVHLSLNALKDAAHTRFITLREFGSKDIFEQRVEQLAEALEQGGWPVIKQQAEYCIYDNNNLLDNGWLPQ